MIPSLYAANYLKSFELYYLFADKKSKKEEEDEFDGDEGLTPQQVRINHKSASWRDVFVG